MSTFDNPSFTTPEDWGNNDDPNDSQKPNKSKLDQIARTAQGRAMQLYAEDINSPLNPEEMLIAREEYGQDEEDYNADYPDYDEKLSARAESLRQSIAGSRKAVVLRISKDKPLLVASKSPSPLFAEPHIESEMDRLEVEEKIKRLFKKENGRSVAPNRDGDRQYPSVLKSRAMRSVGDMKSL